MATTKNICARTNVLKTSVRVYVFHAHILKHTEVSLKERAWIAQWRSRNAPSVTFSWVLCSFWHFIVNVQSTGVFRCKASQQPSEWFPSSVMMQGSFSSTRNPLMSPAPASRHKYLWVHCQAKDSNYNIVPTQQTWFLFSPAICILDLPQKLKITKFAWDVGQYLWQSTHQGSTNLTHADSVQSYIEVFPHEKKKKRTNLYLLQFQRKRWNIQYWIYSFFHFLFPHWVIGLCIFRLFFWRWSNFNILKYKN